MEPSLSPPDIPPEERGRFGRIMRWQGLRWAVPGALGVAALIVGLLLVPDRAPVDTREFNLNVAPQGTAGLVLFQTAQTSSDRYDVAISDLARPPRSLSGSTSSPT